MNQLIEHLRCKMIDLAHERGSLTHPEVIAVSEQLDDYIVKVQQLLKDSSYETTLYRYDTNTEIHGLGSLTDFLDWHDTALRQTAMPPC
ncbi:aspartyl-phosphate phosphatase Spo0E family protein [Alicyclobacillus sp. SO9]|uniref:aspartyl-phosphate phosphatase Spo0E family protein n=1 Tax=Alicyclobacillus sp. SO9 TaxID=2665646 RepID=UPI0018E77C61|nr:aspartyl-phosphate phosphatase Spo0E family protein [Alicyclobacillus sp. SO9]QQE76958.1 aspartyl-phosphate phosphatase Spo0E family protein [Alicyclobacillus sp. SO9]